MFFLCTHARPRVTHATDGKDRLYCSVDYYLRMGECVMVTHGFVYPVFIHAAMVVLFFVPFVLGSTTPALRSLG
jgi:hypothetical protein